MPIDEKSDTEILVWDWVSSKLEDDLKFSLSDNEAKKVATERFREFGVNFPSPNVPPRRITFFSNHDALDDTVSAQILQTNFDRVTWNIWVECTQVAAVWTLFQIRELLNTNNMQINFTFSTGHELVKALHRIGPEDEPHFAVITSAPVHSYDAPLNYQLMSPIHLEGQQVFRKKSGVLNKHSRVFYLGWSTAAAQLERLREREDPALRELAKAKPIASFNFSEFVSWVRRMKGGDCTVLWKPPLWGLNRDNTLEKISQEDFLSPISLYRRGSEIKPKVIEAFSRLFISKWESSYTAWKANPTEAFNQFKALIEKWGQTKPFFHSFRLAAGAGRDVELPKAAHSTDYTMVDWFGQRYTFALGVQSQVVKILWKEWQATGLGLHQQTIRELVDDQKDNFRMTTAFRNHPALGKMIQGRGDGRYQLCSPVTGSEKSKHLPKKA